MKNLWIGFIALILGLSSCEKPVTGQKAIPDGTYFGTFQRTWESGEGQKANISITFSSGKWSGQSDIEHYPALCRGTYEAGNGKLVFSNECIWTADFDWSLILSGEYNFTLIGDSLLFSKHYGNLATGVYTDSYCVSFPKSGMKESPISGTWLESISKTDTLVFSPEYDGLYPVFNLKRKFRVTEGYSLPGYFSGPYWYILGENSISVNWFLSSNSQYNRYYFKLIPEGNELKIGSFFADPPFPLGRDTLTFTKIK